MTKTISQKKPKFLIFSIKRNLNDIIFSISILFVMVLIIFNPAIFSKSTVDGIKLFFSAVLPGLFPFMFLTKMLTEIGLAFKISKKLDYVSQKTFGTPGVSIYCFFMSILSGYPIGAKIIAELYQKKLISDEDAKRMSIFCTTSGPIFVIGSVGVGMLSSFKLGVIIYLSHILSAVICGIAYNLFHKNKVKTKSQNPPQTQRTSGMFSLVLNDTINSILMVGGYITIFYLVSEVFSLWGIIDRISNFVSKLFSHFNISSELISGLLYGLIEVTHGIKNLSSINPISVPLICGLISFSGISIIMQSLSFLKQAKIKTHSFIIIKCVQMLISIVLSYLIIFIIWDISVGF